MSENLNSTVQCGNEAHSRNDGASAATPHTKPIPESPRSLSKNHGRKPVRAAIIAAKPMGALPPTPSTKRSKAARPAIERLKPIIHVPGTSLSKRSRLWLNETHSTTATASPAKTETKPTGTSPGTFRGDHIRGEIQVDTVSARRSIKSMNPINVSGGENSEGQCRDESQTTTALNGRAVSHAKPSMSLPDHSLRDGHLECETHTNCAVAGDDQGNVETHLANVIAQIRELWRCRQSWHRSEKSLTLQAKATCRRYVGGDKAEANKLFGKIEDGDSLDDIAALAAPAIIPLLMGREHPKQAREAVEKELAKLAKSLPIYPWIEATPGVAAGSLAALVGECGDIGSYKSASALCKRMGLAVINGEKQRRVAGVDALKHGYAPQRRSVMWNIGGGLIGGMGKGPRPKVGEDIDANAEWSRYQKQFVRLLRLEVERVTETWNGPEHKREPVEKKGELYESFSAHAAARIKRRIEKQFLAELYGAWRAIAKAQP